MNYLNDHLEREVKSDNVGLSYQDLDYAHILG